MRAAAVDQGRPGRPGQEDVSGQREPVAVQDEAPGSQGACRLDVNPREVAPERVLVAFQQHDVHVGVVARHAPGGEVNGPAAGDPVGNGQAGQKRAGGRHCREAGVAGGSH
jgi:hypothetical protein